MHLPISLSLTRNSFPWRLRTGAATSDALLMHADANRRRVGQGPPRTPRWSAALPTSAATAVTRSKPRAHWRPAGVAGHSSSRNRGHATSVGPDNRSTTMAGSLSGISSRLPSKSSQNAQPSVVATASPAPATATTTTTTTLAGLCPGDKRRVAALVRELSTVSEQHRTLEMRAREERERFERELRRLQEANQASAAANNVLHERTRHFQQQVQHYRAVLEAPPPELPDLPAEVVAAGQPYPESQQQRHQQRQQNQHPGSRQQQLEEKLLQPRPLTPPLSTQPIAAAAAVTATSAAAAAVTATGAAAAAAAMTATGFEGMVAAATALETPAPLDAEPPLANTSARPTSASRASAAVKTEVGIQCHGVADAGTQWNGPGTPPEVVARLGAGPGAQPEVVARLGARPGAQVSRPDDHETVLRTALARSLPAAIPTAPRPSLVAGTIERAPTHQFAGHVGRDWGAAVQLYHDGEEGDPPSPTSEQLHDTVRLLSAPPRPTSPHPAPPCPTPRMYWK